MASTPFLMQATKRMREEPAIVKGERAGPETADRAAAIVVGYGRWPERCPDAERQRHFGDHDRHRHRNDRSLLGAEARVWLGDGASTCCVLPGTRATMILFCMDGIN
jgi:CPA2 family monovalent cation:H+ antiporter-2/glutathione-regulated potassium-efflux system protein KefB